MKTNVDKLYIAENVVDLFGADNLAAAFITGGVASGWGTDVCDIDILICHRDEVDPSRRASFTEFYFDLHQKLNRVPDAVSPGEVMSTAQMCKGLDRVRTLEPTVVIDERDDFDYLCWAGMLVSKKELLVPETQELAEFKKSARGIIDSWAATLCQDTALTDATGLCSDKDKMLGSITSCPGYYDAHQ